MSKICTSCGAMNSDNATNCSRCGKSLPFKQNSQMGNAMTNKAGGQKTANSIPSWQAQPMQGWQQTSSKIYQQQDIHNSRKNITNIKNLPRVGTIVGGLVVLLIIVLIIVKLVKGATPSDSWLTENIPSELLGYEFEIYDFEYYEGTSSVESLVIERRVTENGVDDAYCVVTLSDDRLKRTIYIEMVSRKYDQGGWVLESWSEYRPAEAHMIRGMDEEEVYSYLNTIELYTGLSEYQDISDLESGIISYSCRVDEQHEYVETSGSVVLNGELYVYTDILPHKINLDLEVETSNVKTTWKLDGKFGCDGENSINGKYFNATVNTEGEIVNWDIEYGELSLALGRGFYTQDHTGDGTYEIPEWSGPAAVAELKIPLTEGYYLEYRQDSVWMLNSTTAFAPENELSRR